MICSVLIESDTVDRQRLPFFIRNRSGAAFVDGLTVRVMPIGLDGRRGIAGRRAMQSDYSAAKSLILESARLGEHAD
jgi:hypothetical protein